MRISSYISLKEFRASGTLLLNTKYLTTSGICAVRKFRKSFASAELFFYTASWNVLLMTSACCSGVSLMKLTA